MRSAKIGAAMAAASLVLAGCGGAAKDGSAATDAGGGGTAAAGAAVDPCSFLSAEEVTAITSDAVTSTDSDGDTCYYHSKPDEELRVRVLKSGGKQAMDVVHRTSGVLAGMGNAVADKGGAGADVNDMLKKDKSATPPLGDEAAWGMVSMLSVRKGDMFVEVTPLMMHDPANHSGYPLVGTEEKRAMATEVAEKVLAKL